MNIELYSKTNNIAQDTKDYLETKLAAFEKHCPKEVLKARIELEENTKVASGGDKFRAEATISIPQHTFRAEATGATFVAAIDKMMPKLNKQAEKEKTKLIKRKR